MLPGLIVLAPSASFSFNRDHYLPRASSYVSRARTRALAHVRYFLSHGRVYDLLPFLSLDAATSLYSSTHTQARARLSRSLVRFRMCVCVCVSARNVTDMCMCVRVCAKYKAILVPSPSILRPPRRRRRRRRV